MAFWANNGEEVRSTWISSEIPRSTECVENAEFDNDGENSVNFAIRDALILGKKLLGGTARVESGPGQTE